MSAELILEARNGTGESPVWIASEQALYWTNIPGREIWRWSAKDHSHQVWRTPEMVGCLSPDKQGHWIAAMESGLFQLRLPPHSSDAISTRLAAVTHTAETMRFNDGRCDRQGRFLAGTMFMDMSAARTVGVLYSPGQKNSGLRTLLDGFITPNGLAFSPDGKTMYLSDSHPKVQTIWAFDYDTDTGTPSNRRVFVDMNPYPGRPDGAAVDQDGCYWICGNDAGQIHRFTPEGKLDRSLPVPVKKPAMCAFGGPDLSTLYVTSIRPDGVDLSDQPLAGGVFALNPSTRGLPEPTFHP